MKVNKNKKEKLALGKWRRIAILFVVLLTFVISFIMIVQGISNDPKKNDILCTYHIQNGLDYRVYLYDNKFYEEEYLESDHTYPTDLIKKVAVDFSYQYSNSILQNIVYDYNVVATLSGNYNDPENNDLLVKKYVLKDTINNELSNQNTLIINETFDIDFPFYRNLIKDYETQLKITLISKLDVLVTVNIKTDEFSDTKTFNLSIPLTDATTRFTKEYIADDSQVLMNEGYKKQIDYSKVTIGSILLVSSIIAFMYVFRSLFLVTKKNQYQKELNRILKNYGEVIVEVGNKMDMSNLQLLEIKSIEDMIDLEEELKTPILYYEKEENMEGWFMIKKDDQLFRFILIPSTLEDIAIATTKRKITNNSTKKKSTVKKKNTKLSSNTKKTSKKSNNKKE